MHSPIPHPANPAPRSASAWPLARRAPAALAAALALALAGCAHGPAGTGTSATPPVWAGAPGANLATGPAPMVKAPQVANPQRVLMVGNSYFYYNDSLHNMLRRMVVADQPAAEKTLQYKSATIGGSHLEHHNIDWLTKPGQIGVKEPFELVVLGGISSAAANADHGKRHAAAAKAAAQVVRERGGQVALYMTHAYVPPNKGAHKDGVRQLERYYVALGNELNAPVIPVALAFEEAYRRIPGIQLHQDYDGSHPTAEGTYLAAAVAYATLYGRSPVGNAFDAMGKVSEPRRRQLQQVADDTVKAFMARR